MTRSKANPGLLIQRMQRDPVGHIKDVQGLTTLEPYQESICNAIAEHDRVVIRACHGIGKTFILARVVLWLGSCFRGAKIITTAPTFALVEKLLWSEIRSGFRLSKYPLGGRMLNTEWKIRDDWFAFGLSPKEDGEGGQGQGTASNFQGFHGPLVAVIFDEATGVPVKRWTQAEGMMTSANVKWIAIGNPTSSTSEFAKCFKSAAWHKISLSCFDSPNLKANGISDLESLTAELDYLRQLSDQAQFERMKGYKIARPQLTTLASVMRMAIKWGIDHPLFVSKALGQFPLEDDHVLMPLGAVEAAQLRDAFPTLQDRYSIGVDVARFGSDKTVITVLHGAKVIRRVVLIKRSTTQVSGEVLEIIRQIDSRNIVIAIDATGIGSGVCDELKESARTLGHKSGIEIREVHFGGGLTSDEDKKLYANQKAKLFVKLGQDLRENLCLTQDSVYQEELPTITFSFDSKGRYVIESKDEYKKRTGRPSPDDADSLALANSGRYDNERVGQFIQSLTQRSPGIAPSLTSGDLW